MKLTQLLLGLLLAIGLVTAASDINITGTVYATSATLSGTLYADSINVTGSGTTELSGPLDMGAQLITNIGNAGTDFTSGGGLTLAGTLDVNGAGPHPFSGNITLLGGQGGNLGILLSDDPSGRDGYAGQNSYSSQLQFQNQIAAGSANALTAIYQYGDTLYINRTLSGVNGYISIDSTNGIYAPGGFATATFNMNDAGLSWDTGTTGFVVDTDNGISGDRYYPYYRTSIEFTGWGSNAPIAIFNASAAGDTPIVARAFSGQTGNLTEWQDSTGAKLLAVNGSGALEGGTTAMTLKSNTLMGDGVYGAGFNIVGMDPDGIVEHKLVEIGGTGDTFIMTGDWSTNMYLGRGGTSQASSVYFGNSSETTAGRIYGYTGGLVISGPQDSAAGNGQVTIESYSATNGAIVFTIIDNNASDSVGFSMNAANVDSSAWTQGNLFKIANDGDAKILVDYAGRTGLGDTGPDFNLEIVNSTANGAFAVSSAAGNDGNIFVIDEAGYVGIGVASPSEPLHVVSATPATTGIRLNGILDLTNSTGTATGGFSVGITGGTHYFNIGDFYSGEPQAGVRIYANDAYRLTIIPTGEVGIGTNLLGTTAQQLLVQTGDAAKKGFVVKAYNSTQSANLFEAQNSTGSALVTIDEVGKLGLGLDPANGILEIAATGSTELYFTGSSSANVGSNTDLYITPGSTKALHLGAGGVNDKITIESGGNVGIGTTAPNSTLHIIGKNVTLKASVGGGYDDFNIFDFNTDTAGFRIRYDDNTGATYLDNLYDNAAGDLYIRTKGAGTPITAITVESAGTVGINTTSPNSSLHVIGDINVSATGTCLYLPGGGRLCGNTTCTTLYSPDGNSKTEACN